MIVGWMISGIMTSVGALSNDPNSEQYKARADYGIDTIDKASWIYVPHPGIHTTDHNKLEDSKCVIRIRKSAKYQQHNDHMKNNKRTKKREKKNIAQKTKGRATRSPLQTEGTIMCSGR